MIYEPAEDTELALRAVEALEGDICVDVGSGSCIIARKLATKCRWTLAIDIEPQACKTCPKEVDVICGNGLTSLRRADVVVSNLPYLPPEEPLDPSIHDLGLTQQVLRWVSMYRPGTVVLVFSSLGRASHIAEALNAMCTIVRVERLHLFFESIYAVTATCGQLRR